MLRPACCQIQNLRVDRRCLPARAFTRSGPKHSSSLDRTCFHHAGPLAFDSARDYVVDEKTDIESACQSVLCTVHNQLDPKFLLKEHSFSSVSHCSTNVHNKMDRLIQNQTELRETKISCSTKQCPQGASTRKFKSQQIAAGEVHSYLVFTCPPTLLVLKGSATNLLSGCIFLRMITVQSCCKMFTPLTVQSCCKMFTPLCWGIAYFHTPSQFLPVLCSPLQNWPHP